MIRYSVYNHTDYLHGSTYTHKTNRFARCHLRPCRACLVFSDFFPDMPPLYLSSLVINLCSMAPCRWADYRPWLGEHGRPFCRTVPQHHWTQWWKSWSLLSNTDSRGTSKSMVWHILPLKNYQLILLSQNQLYQILNWLHRGSSARPCLFWSQPTRQLSSFQRNLPAFSRSRLHKVAARW